MEIIEKNKLKMTDDRIADFRQTISEMVAVKNGVIPPDSQNIFKSPKSKQRVGDTPQSSFMIGSGPQTRQ